MPFPSLESTFPICEHDMGVVVKAILDQGPKANGKLFPIVSEFIQVISPGRTFLIIGPSSCVRFRERQLYWIWVADL